MALNRVMRGSVVGDKRAIQSDYIMHTRWMITIAFDQILTEVIAAFGGKAIRICGFGI